MPKILLNPYRNNLSIDGLVLVHDNWLDQGVRTGSDVVFNSLQVGDLTANGNILLTGTVTQVNTDNLLVKDAFIELNNDNIDPLLVGGIRIHRGNLLPSFDISYNESDQTLRVGNTSNLQPVAVREESPTDGYIGVWESSFNRFRTTNTISIDMIFTNIKVSGELKLGDNTTSPVLVGNASNDLFLNALGDIFLGDELALNKRVVIPVGRSVLLKSSTSDVSLSEVSGDLFLDSNLRLSLNKGINWGGLGKVVSSTGDNVNIQGDVVYLNPSSKVSVGNVSIDHNSVGSMSIELGNKYKVASVGSLVLESGVSGRVEVNNLSITSGVLGNIVNMDVNSSGDLLIDGPSNIVLSPGLDVLVNVGKSLSFGTNATSISSGLGDLILSSSGGITLNAVSQVYIPLFVPLNMGTNSSMYEGVDGTLIVRASNSDISLTPGVGKGVKIPLNNSLIFGSTEQIYTNGNELVIDAQGRINLTSILGVRVPQGKPLEFGDSQHRMYQDVSSNIVIESSQDILITAVGNGNVKFSSKVNIGSTLLYQDIDGALSLSSEGFAGYVKSTSDILVTSTTSATSSGDGSLKTLGGIHVGKNLSVSGGGELRGVYTVGTLSTTAITLEDGAVPIQVTNSSASGVVMEMKGTWDTIAGYTIGRGSSTLGGGRGMVFTLPSYAVYGIGAKPSFIFSSSSGVEYMRVVDTGVTVSSNLSVSGSGEFGGIVTSGGFTNTLGNFEVTNSGVSVKSGLYVENVLNVIDSNQIAVLTVTNTGMVSYKESTFLSNISVGGTLTSTGKLYANDGCVFGGNVNVDGNRLYNVSQPQLDEDVATKLYVDSVARGRTDKLAVTVGSIGVEVNLVDPLYSLDSETLSLDDRVLLKDQTDPVKNGIYVITVGNILARASDMSVGSDAAGASVFVMGGVVNASVGLVVVGTEVIVGTDAISWTPFSGASAINVSLGLAKVGNVLSARVDNFSLQVNSSNDLGIKASYIGTGLENGTVSALSTSSDQSHVTKVGTLTTGEWRGSVISAEYGGTGLSSVSAGYIPYGDGVGSSELSTSDKFYFSGDSLGVGTSSPEEYLHVENVASTYTGSFILISDTDTLISQSSGLRIRSLTKSCSLVLDSDGVLVLGQDDTNVSSRVSISTQQVKRLTVDASGNVLIGTNVATSGYLLTVNGGITGTSVNASSTLSVPSCTISDDPLNTGGVLLTSGTVRLTGSSLITESDANLGNIRLISSVSGKCTILSTDKVTNAPLSLYLRVSNVSSGLCAVGFTGGFLVPNTFQIGGTESDQSTGFQLKLQSDNLEIIPGVSGKRVLFQGPTSHNEGLRLIDKLFPNDSFNFSVSSGTLKLEGSSASTMNLLVGGSGGQGLIVTLEGPSGGYVRYDPTTNGVNGNMTGGILSTSSDVGVLLGNELRLSTVSRYTFGNTMEGIFNNVGWYYLGELGVGRTSIIAYLSWDIKLEYDGVGSYTINTLSIRSRVESNLVIYKTSTDVYHVYLKVLRSPSNVYVTESPIEFLFDNYEGVSTSPTGLYSGYDNTWVLDFDLSMSQSVGLLEVGSLSVGSTSTLSNVTLTGTTQVTGYMNTGNTSGLGSEFRWDSSVTSDVLAELTTSVPENVYTLYSKDASVPKIKLSKVSGESNIYMNAINASTNPNALVISNDTSSILSKIVLSTRGNSRLVINDVGNTSITSTVDNIESDIGALVVSGGMVVSKRVKIKGELQVPELKLVNGVSVSSIKCDVGGNVSMENKRVVNVSDPVNGTDGVNKRYVESVLQGLDTKESVKAASDGVNVSLSVALSALDNVLVQDGNRILLKDQTDSVENGIYIVKFAAAPIRSDDMLLGSSGNGVYVYVEQGIVNGTSGWVCNVLSGEDTVGVNGMIFVQFSGAGQITAGGGIGKVGNTIYANVDDESLEVSAGKIRLKSDIAGVGLSGGSGVSLSVSDITHLSSVGTLTSGVWNGSIIGSQYGGTGRGSFNVGSVVYSDGVALREGLFYFDDVNVRVGINTLNPTSGLTIKDRDIQISQEGVDPLYLLLTSTHDDYSYGIRNDVGSLILSGGSGISKNTLTDIASFNSQGVLSVTSGVKSSYLELSMVKYTSNSVERLTNGELQVSYFSANNAGSLLRLYGGLGTSSSVVNSEYMTVGYNGTSNVISSGSSGSGVSRSIVMTTGGNVDQFVLESTGNNVMSGSLSIMSLDDSVSTSSGAVVVSGGMGVGGKISTVKLNVTDTSSSAMSVGGDVTVGGSIVMSNTSGGQLYKLTSDAGKSLTIESDSVGEGCFIQVKSKSSSNILDSKLRIFGKGGNVTFNSEWMEVGYEASTVSYVIRGNNVGTTSERPLILSSITGEDQIILSPSGTVDINSDVTLETLTVTSSLDAISHLMGGAVTISGGLAVNKTLYVGNNVESAIYKVTNRLEYSNASSIDKVLSRYTSSGKLHFYGNSSTSLNVHIGDSGGPTSVDKELLYLGYKNASTLCINSTSEGSGTLRDLSIETKLYPNQLLLSSTDGSVTFAKRVILQDTDTSALLVSGGVEISRQLSVIDKVTVGNSTSGDLLELRGIQTSWKFHSKVATPGKLILQSVGSDTLLDIHDSSDTSILLLDTALKQAVLSSTLVVKGNSYIKNTSGVNKFVFDTTSHTLDMSSGKIRNLSLPQSPLDAVNKSYVDNLVQGLNVKESVVASSQFNVNILNPVTTLDGEGVVEGDRVLIMSQVNNVENGIYKVQAGNFLTRTDDLSTGLRAAGVFTFIQKGIENGDKGFVCITDYPLDIVGTHGLNFSQFNGSGSDIDIGNGLVYNGNLLEVNLEDNSGLVFSGSKLRVDPGIAGSGLTFTINGTIDLNPITELSTVTIGVWNANTIGLGYGGTGNTVFANKSLVYSNGSSLQSTVGIEWDNINMALGINGTAGPNGASDGLTIVDKDIYMRSDVGSSSLLLGDQLGNYNWRMRRVDAQLLRSTFPISSHNEITMSRNGNVGVVTGDPGDPFYMTTTNGATWFVNGALEEFAWGETSVSEDGSYILLCGQQDYLYVSQNSGVTFTAKVTNFERFWEWTDISDSGQYMMASSLADGVHVSSDYGSTWFEVLNIPTDFVNVGFVHVSKNGDAQFAGYFGGELYVSTNYGTSFVAHGIRSGNYYDIAESFASDYMVLYEYPGSLFVSSDLGITWTERLGSQARNWVSVDISSDGSVITATTAGDLIFVSTDFGVTFTSRIDASPREWTFTKVTPDGETIFAGGLNIPVFMSIDAGSTWSELSGGNKTVYSAALSPVTKALFYVEYNGMIYSYASVPPTNLILSSGKSTVKASLVDSVVFTDNGLLGLGYNESTAAGISGTLDINGTLIVSKTVTLKTPLDVTSGGTGSSTLPYGVLLSNGNLPYTTTGGLSDGAILIGKNDNSGGIVVESGSTLRSHLGLGIGVNVQSYSSSLDSLGVLSATSGSFIVGNGSVFVTQTSTAVRSTLGLGTLALLNNVNNSYWLGTQLSVSNGGTGSVSFTSKSLPYYNGSVLSSSIVYNDTSGVGIGKSTVFLGTKLLAYGGDFGIQASDNNVASSMLLYNANDNVAWRIRREEDGITSGNSNLVISGGVSNVDKTSLSDTLMITSSGVVKVLSQLESSSVSTGGMVVSGGVGIEKGMNVGGILGARSTVDSISVSSGGFVVDGGIGIIKSVYIGGVTRMTSTIDATSSTSGGVVVSGGLGISKTLYSTGEIIVDRISSVGSKAIGLTIAGDTSSWVENVSIIDSNRHVSIMGNSVNGAVVLSMRNQSANYGWDQIVEGGSSGSNRLVFQTNGTATKTWMTLDAVSGTLTVKGTNDHTSTTSSSLVVNGGIYALKGIRSLSSISGTSELSVSSSPSTSPVRVGLYTDTGTGGVLFLNDSTTSTDGGVNGMTLRNNNGSLNLQGSGLKGITITGTTGNVSVTSTEEATSSSSGGSLTISGGVAVGKKLYVGGDVSIGGTLSVPSLTSVPSVTTAPGDMVNISTLITNSVKLTTINDVNTLQLTFKVTPTASASVTRFTFSLPNKSSNLSDSLDIYSANANGYESLVNLNNVGVVCTGVNSTKNGTIKFTSLSTGIHYIQVYISYSTQ